MLRTTYPITHSSVYFCRYLQNNWDMWRQFVSAKASSFNQYANSCFVHDFQTNVSDVLSVMQTTKSQKWNFYQPLPKSLKEIAVDLTDGQLVDLVNLTGGWRDRFISELKRREFKYEYSKIKY